MAQVPILRRKPEGEQPYLLSLTISHPVGPEGSQIEIKWDGAWVEAHNLPPAFTQQVFANAFTLLFASGLVACGVMPPQPGMVKN